MERCEAIGPDYVGAPVPNRCIHVKGHGDPPYNDPPHHFDYGIREYLNAESPVQILQLDCSKIEDLKYWGLKPSGNPWVIEAYNEGGNNATYVDILDVLRWVKHHKPELLDQV